MNWELELNELLDNGCSDSMIEDFIELHPEVDGRKVWDIVAEYTASAACKGCAHIQNHGMMPCIRCTRMANLKDYYIAR